MICHTAKSISLNMSIVIELLFAHGPCKRKQFKHSTYSVEDIASGEACIKFHCPKNASGTYENFDCDSFVVSCKCCGNDLFTESKSMGDVLKELQDAMFCHFFKSVLQNVNDLLFDQNFDHNHIK